MTLIGLVIRAVILTGSGAGVIVTSPQRTASGTRPAADTGIGMSTSGTTTSGLASISTRIGVRLAIAGTSPIV